MLHPDWVRRKGRVRKSLTKEALRWKGGSVCQVENYGKVLQERRNEIHKVIKEKKHSTMFHSKNCKLFAIVEE